MPRVMTPEGQAMLDAYPPFLQGDQTLRAICNAVGPEFVALNGQIDRLQNGQVATLADDASLALMEAELGLSVRPAEMGLEQRRGVVMAFMARLTMDATGTDWERLADMVLGTGWTYEVGGVNNSVLTVTIGFAASSLQAQIAAQLIRTITPASLEIVFAFGGAFILDSSVLDTGTLG